MKGNSAKALAYGVPTVLLGVLALQYILSGQTTDWSQLSLKSVFQPACSAPIRYEVGAFDERFGISRPEFEEALEEAALLWNEAAGKTVFETGLGGVAVNLVYSEHQRTAELGAVIDAEQAAYEQAERDVDALRAEYLALRARFESREKVFDRRVAAYDEEVAYWNARGGAPPGKYEELQQEKAALAQEEESLNALAGEVNATVREMNAAIDELNRLAKKTNAKVGVYNKHAGTDFDQGTYTEDGDGRRIDIYEFTNETELKRVFAHELGHALGIGHIENPDSIMYSYNVGESFELSAEDRAALTALCGVE